MFPPPRAVPMLHKLMPTLALLLVLASCTLQSDGDGRDATAAGDTVTAAGSGPALGPPVDAGVDGTPDSAGARVEPLAAAQQPETARPPVTGQQPVAPRTVEERLDALLAGQATLTARLDSISTAQEDTAAASGGQPQSGEVLGEARQRVRSFGVGIAMSLVVLVLFNLVIRSLVWLLDTLAERNPSRRLFYKRLVPIVRIVLWVFAAYLIVSVIFRVDAQGIFAAAAAIGVAIGFAAQDLLKNLFGGLILVFDQPFQVGDKVSVAGTYGEVVSIGLRSTRIVTPDDNLVSVPNAQVVDQQVANANAGQLHCQVVTDLYLPGWADEVTAKRIAFEAAASSKYVYLNKPIVTLVADVFKETFLTRVRVKAYVLDPRLEFLFQSDVTERAREGFRRAGLLTRANELLPHVEHSAVGVEQPVTDRASEGDAHGDG